MWVLVFPFAPAARAVAGVVRGLGGLYAVSYVEGNRIDGGSRTLLELRLRPAGGAFGVGFHVEFACRCVRVYGRVVGY